MQKGDTVQNIHSDASAIILDIEYHSRVQDGPIDAVYLLDIAGELAPSRWSDMEMAEHWKLDEVKQDEEG